MLDLAAYRPILKETAHQRAVAQGGDVRIAIVLRPVEQHLRRAPRASLVTRLDQANASAARPLGVGQRNMSVAGIEDASQVAVRQPANIGKRLVRSGRFAARNHGVLRPIGRRRWLSRADAEE